MKKENLAYLHVCVPILTWALAPTLVKILLVNMHFMHIILFPSGIALLSLLAVIVVKKKAALFLEYGRMDYARMLSLGFIGVFLQYVFLYSAIDLSTAQEAFIINYLWPLLVVIFAAPILKERLSPIKLAGLLLGFAGVYTIATRATMVAEFVHPLGNILALLTALVVAIYFVFNKKYDYDGLISLFVFYVPAFVFSLISLPFIPIVPSFPVHVVGIIIFVGVVSYALAYIFWFSALRMGDTAKISNMGYLTPFVSLVYIYFLLDEPILPSSVIGLILIMSGILVQHITK
jgi:drug/metabolite transporter (DMT)-like permease